MVPIRGEWTRFSDESEKIRYFREWGLIPPKSTILRPVMVVDGYLGVPEPCQVVGYKEDYTAVIELSDGYHAIFGEYLAELQPKANQSLPRGMCFVSVLENYIVLDIETTGFDRINDEIIEIAAIRYSYGHKLDTYQTLVCPKKEIPRDIVKLTGITMDHVSVAPTIDEIAPDFLQFLGTTPIIGHNAVSFDVPFISAQLGQELPNPVLDTLPMARAAFDLLDCHKLEYLKNALHLSDSASHRALDDVETTNALMWACLAPRRYEPAMWQAFMDQKKRTPRTSRNASNPSRKKGAFRPQFQNVDIKSIQPSKQNLDQASPLFEKNIVFTGNLSLSREDAMQLAVDAGAILKSSVSKKTSYLVVGKQDKSIVGSNGMSSKEEKARALNAAGSANIEIINEETFLALIAKGGVNR